MGDPPAPSSPPSAHLLVGRGRERGGLVLIGSEAGLRQPSLAEASLPEAEQRDALVLMVHCYARSEAPPYDPWHKLFPALPSWCIYRLLLFTSIVMMNPPRTMCLRNLRDEPLRAS